MGLHKGINKAVNLPASGNESFHWGEINFMNNLERWLMSSYDYVVDESRAGCIRRQQQQWILATTLVHIFWTKTLATFTLNAGIPWHGHMSVTFRSSPKVQVSLLLSDSWYLLLEMVLANVRGCFSRPRPEQHNVNYWLTKIQSNSNSREKQAQHAWSLGVLWKLYGSVWAWKGWNPVRRTFPISMQTCNSHSSPPPPQSPPLHGKMVTVRWNLEKKTLKQTWRRPRKLSKDRRF